MGQGQVCVESAILARLFCQCSTDVRFTLDRIVQLFYTALDR